MEEVKRPEDNVNTVDVITAKNLIGQGHLYLDVRTIEEFGKGHIESALNAPYLFKTPEGKVKNPEFLTQVSAICKKDDYLVVGCNSGGRSILASVDLINAGYKYVTNMEGGYNAWLDNVHGGDKSVEQFKTACKFRPSSEDKVNTVDVITAKNLLGQGHLYLDVRTNEEFDKGHIESALNAPYLFMTPEGKVKNPEFLTQVSAICKKDDHLVVGCYSGGRSVLASVDLLNAGYKYVTNMAGGYNAWLDNAHGGDKSAEQLKTACKFGSS